MNRLSALAIRNAISRKIIRQSRSLRLASSPVPLYSSSFLETTPCKKFLLRRQSCKFRCPCFPLRDYLPRISSNTRRLCKILARKQASHRSLISFLNKFTYLCKHHNYAPLSVFLFIPIYLAHVEITTWKKDHFKNHERRIEFTIKRSVLWIYLSLKVKRTSHETESISKKSSLFFFARYVGNRLLRNACQVLRNFPVDDARNAVSQVRGGIFAETLREATVASAEQWPFLL